MTEDIVISLDRISKMYRLFTSKSDRMKEALHPGKKVYHKEFYALNELSLKVRKGEILGVVGMNGSGKSTLLKVVAGIIQPTKGSLSVQGSVVPLLELGSGFNPEFSGYENIYFYNSILGYSRKRTDEMVARILDFAEIGDFIHQPLKTYSSGMKARLAFAVSVNVDPDVLIVDEILSVGDELFRRKSFKKMEEFFKAGKTILFVSHSEAHINQLCTRAIMLDHGRIVLEGAPKFVTMNYTKFMFSSPEKRNVLLRDFELIAKSQEEVQADLLPEPEQVRVPGRAPSTELKEVAFFIPNFHPKSTTITNNGELSVSEFCMKTTGGQKVNALVPQDEYFFSYRVSFRENLGKVNFGLGIKTITGVPASWKLMPGRGKYFPKEVGTGVTAEVTWRFRCLLMPGIYFISVSIRSEIEHTESLVYKGADVFVFKVLGEEKVDKGGIFDPGLEATVRYD